MPRLYNKGEAVALIEAIIKQDWLNKDMTIGIIKSIIERTKFYYE